MDKLNKNRKKITIWIIVGCVLIYALSWLITGADKGLEEVYYISQIVSSLFVIAGVVIAVWQYYLSTQVEIRKSKMEVIQKAIDMSEYYKDVIIKNGKAIRYVFENVGIAEILNEIDSEKMIYFDSAEMKELISDSNIDKLKAIENSEKFVESVIDADRIYNLHLMQDIKGESENNKQAKIIRTFMMNVVYKTLNSMEYFAMGFIRKTADEKTVYQSLHQTYIESVRLLYYVIAKDNEAAGSYFYTNVTQLYKKWNGRKKKQEKEYEEKKKQAEDEENDAKRKSTISGPVVDSIN